MNDDYLIDGKLTLIKKKIQRDLSQSRAVETLAFHFLCEKCQPYIKYDHPFGYPAEIHIKYPLNSSLKKEFVSNFMYNEWDIPLEKYYKIATDLNDAITGAFIGESELSWLDSLQPEMWYWAWCYMQITPTVIYSSPLMFEPSSPAECLAFIKERFLQDYTTTKLDKLKYISNMKTQWSRVLISHSKVNWLNNKNKVRYQNAWSYICDRGYSYNFLQPMTPEEIYYCVFSTVFTWDFHLTGIYSIPGPHREEKPTQEQLISRINKAWKQKEFRRQQSEKLVNIRVERDVYDGLKALAKVKGRSLKKVLEELALSEEQPLVSEVVGDNVDSEGV